ncbi:PREDICTED: uncharacterized protein LOC105989705 [Dipodomys ordii]|uniref:Uncharacterized protein LOC105989705 n=1 Tax=Dipodomys ordii TaxID=10020 RepID=A0A1S3FL73_DIPOR|nr:PREDICTED: uncharacterized protein LOC105989705 [Dipodomys ordii]
MVIGSLSYLSAQQRQERMPRPGQTAGSPPLSPERTSALLPRPAALRLAGFPRARDHASTSRSAVRRHVTGRGTVPPRRRGRPGRGPIERTEGARCPGRVGARLSRNGPAGDQESVSTSVAASVWALAPWRPGAPRTSRLCHEAVPRHLHLRAARAGCAQRLLSTVEGAQPSPAQDALQGNPGILTTPGTAKEQAANEKILVCVMASANPLQMGTHRSVVARRAALCWPVVCLSSCSGNLCLLRTSQGPPCHFQPPLKCAGVGRSIVLFKS